jgi:hypothetical protein
MMGIYSPYRENAWEENIRVYLDSSEEDALIRAKEDARADEVSYQTADGFELSWNVQSVKLVKELEGDSLDGQEIFSRSLIDAEARSLLSKIV